MAANQYLERLVHDPQPEGDGSRSGGGGNAVPASPTRKFLSSQEAGWTSLQIQAFEGHGIMEAFDTTASPDLLVVVATKGQGEVECFSDGCWRGAAYYPGIGGMTPSGQTRRLRWHPCGPKALETLHLSIPTDVFTGAADQYRRLGARVQEQPLNTLSFFDPTVSQVARSLERAVRAAAPDLYAQSAAQFLATHLLSLQSEWGNIAQDTRRPGKLGTRRLTHVLDYMNTHYKEAVSLDQLATEAGVSRFHFARLFKEAVGVAPHQHLVRIRMDVAAFLLGTTESSVLEVALACGFQSAAHFTAAFQKHFSQTPSSYREKLPGRSAP